MPCTYRGGMSALMLDDRSSLSSFPGRFFSGSEKIVSTQRSIGEKRPGTEARYSLKNTYPQTWSRSTLPVMWKCKVKRMLPSVTLLSHTYRSSCSVYLANNPGVTWAPTSCWRSCSMSPDRWGWKNWLWGLVTLRRRHWQRWYWRGDTWFQYFRLFHNITSQVIL